MENDVKESVIVKGRGTSLLINNKFSKTSLAIEHPEGIDEPMLNLNPETKVYYDFPKKIVNKVTSPDVGMAFSVNPYQGCEHGCIYCYARNSHEFWGWNAGLDFEQKIMVKKNAAALLENHILQNSWKPQPIVISGNTDCYQPLEKKMKITRSLLEMFLRYRHPVGIITKNVLLLRDLDPLEELGSYGLLRVYFSITTLDEKLRRKLEPRTATAQKKLDAIHILSKKNIPVGIMNAPLIPGLNHYECPKILKAASEAGALSAGYTVVRLNGALGELFHDWLMNNYPARADKVWNQIQELHHGKVNDSTWGERIKGSGNISNIIADLFNHSKKKYFGDRKMPEYNLTAFRKGGNYALF